MALGKKHPMFAKSITKVTRGIKAPMFQHRFGH